LTNKIETLYTTIATLLNTAGISNVLRIPDDIRRIGNYFPMALLQEGTQDYLLTSGQQYEYDVVMNIYIVSDVIEGQSKYMNDLQVAVFNQLFANANLSGAVRKIDPISVDPGASTQLSGILVNAGFSEACVVRQISCRIKLLDARY